MKSAKKAIIAALCAVMLVVGSVAGTMAYLTSTDEVVNTFTVGNVQIKLDEANANADGKPVNNEGTEVELAAAPRVTSNRYKLMPGHTYIKDPTIHVDSTSEKCWLFVKVEDGIATIEDNKTIATQMSEKGWTLVSGETNVYAYRSIANASDNISVFDGFKLKGDANISTYANAQIKVTAYAVQANGFTTAADAWAAAPATWTTPAAPDAPDAPEETV